MKKGKSYSLLNENVSLIEIDISGKLTRGFRQSGQYIIMSTSCSVEVKYRIV